MCVCVCASLPFTKEVFCCLMCKTVGASQKVFTVVIQEISLVYQLHIVSFSVYLEWFDSLSQSISAHMNIISAFIEADV